MFLKEIQPTFVLLLLLTVVANFVARRLNFYKIQETTHPNIYFHQVFAIFILFNISLWIIPILNTMPFGLLLMYFLPTFLWDPLLLLCSDQLIFNLFIGALTCLTMIAYTQSSITMKKIWGGKPSTFHSIFKDIFIGISSTIVVWSSTILFLNFLKSFLRYINLYDSIYEQNAIRYLKATIDSPLYMSLTLMGIICVSPIIEEIVFRGSLQTYLKKYLSQKMAIVLSAVCFALYHFSFAQNTANLWIIPSLCVFGCFLGFVYEKQQSLYTSISLHATFNLMNSLLIILT